jgi:hypothetical protein
MGAVAEAFALGLHECGETEAAITWYERTMACNDASASMKAQEQLGKLRARQAWEQVRAVSGHQSAEALVGTLANARAQVVGAVRNLALLAQLLPTLERHGLVGSAYKRLALLERRAGDEPAEVASLEMARQAYAQATELALAQQQPEMFRPAINELAIGLVTQLLRRQPGSKTRPQTLDKARVDAVVRSLKAKALDDPDFRCYAGLIEIDLLLAMAERRLAAGLGPLLDRFAQLHSQVASESLWARLADLGDLLLQPYARAYTGAERQAALKLLAALNVHAGRRHDGA